jgi:PhzF family phenazine biosynthesis protein
MKIEIFQVDAFTDRLFGGNPAAVCPLEKWIPSETMQQIAMENNLSETAFFVKEGDDFHIRWFTPLVEVDLCGHATLATSFIIFEILKLAEEKITYTSRSGRLFVTKNNDKLTLDFPQDEVRKTEAPSELLRAMGVKPLETYKGKTDWMFVLGSEKEIEEFVPDATSLLKVDSRGIIITAKGNKADFVSRFFAPQSGILEDPVTGSAHTTLAPYWSEKLGKKELVAIQLSQRKGYLNCEISGDRVKISGSCRMFLRGEIEVDEFKI